MRKRIFLVSSLIIFGSGIGLLMWLFGDLPDPKSLPDRVNIPSVRITDRFGNNLYEVLPEGGGRHASLPLELIPQALQEATIATEDANFYSNPGVDLRGILRAFWINLQGGETLAGGSTITQQVARNLLLTEAERGERSLHRKLREGFLAWQLSRHYSKQEILAFYLNQTYYGGMAYGVEAAAQTFFGKPVSDLDLAECALLAGLPQAPALYNPYTDPNAAETRRGIVLDLMKAQGYLTPEQTSLAKAEPIGLAAEPYPIKAPHFVMLVRGQLDTIFASQRLLDYQSLIVRTTLNLDWQNAAERAISRQINALQHSPDGLGHNVNSAALVALDPNTGEIVAMVGSPDFFDEQHGGAINMTISPRQPGSALKPLIYAAAMDPSLSSPWTPATALMDVTTAFVTHDNQAYIPENYDGLEHGPVLLRQALGSSLNIPAVITLDHIGLETAFRFSTRLGITTLQDPEVYDLSLALGGGAVRLIELTGAYGAFANGGFRVNPYAILEVTDLTGQVLYSARPPAAQRVMDERLAWLISDILSDDSARQTGFGLNSVLNIGRPAAVKTGTTTNFHDNWTVGYTPELVTGVWVGNTDYHAMRDVTGLTGAAPIWHAFMRSVLDGMPQQGFPQPPGMIQVEVCSLSGLLPGAACPYRRLEWFIAGTQPLQQDTYYRSVEIDTATGFLATQATPPERRREIVAFDLPAQTHAWARKEGLALWVDLQKSLTNDPDHSPSLTSLAVASPAQNSTYHLASGFSPEAQRIPLEIVSSIPFKEVRLFLDGQEVAHFTQSPYRFFWQIEPGEHQVWAVGVQDNGNEIESEHSQFTVLPP